MRRLGRFFRTRASRKYNSKNWPSAALNGRIAWVFGDQKGLDISARSKIRMKEYRDALKIYEIAEKNGYRLRDHYANKCRSQIALGLLVDAFKSSQMIDPLLDYDPVPSISRLLRSYSQAERRDIVLDMMAISDVPESITFHLSEWSKADVKRKFEKNSLGEADISKSMISQLHVKKSPEFLLGSMIVDAYNKPGRIPSLPFRIISQGLKLRSERSFGGDQDNSLAYNNQILYEKENSILFFPTNGVGFGHFARCFAIAERIRRDDPEVELVFLTTMPTLHYLLEIGAIAYHLPGRYRYSDISASDWNSLFSNLFRMILRQHRPKAFIFDGAYPYKGMTEVLKQLEAVPRYWLRRSGEISSAKPLPPGRMSAFDFVIKPGDSIKVESMEEVDSSTRLVRCDPILISDRNNLHPTGSLRQRLGIPKEAVLSYVQLGAGKINEISHELKNTIDAITSHPSAYVIYGESVIGERRLFDHPRIRTLREFPNSRYFSDIDFAVLAGGYNSYHEAVQFSIPTIMYPNLKTKRDDQSARVRDAGELGCMIVLKNRNKKSITAAVDRIMDHQVRRAMREAFRNIELRNGAHSVADLLNSKLIK